MPTPLEAETGAFTAPFDMNKRNDLAKQVMDARTALDESNDKLISMAPDGTDALPDMDKYAVEGRKNLSLQSRHDLLKNDLEKMDLRNPEKILKNQENMTDERVLFNRFLRAKDEKQAMEMLRDDDFTGLVADAPPGSGVDGKLMFIPFKNAMEANSKGQITKEMIAGSASNTSSGQNAVRTETYPGIVERLAEYGGVARACYQFNTTNGETITVPQIDQSDDEGEVLTAQNTPVDDENIPNIGRIQMQSDTLSSKRIAVAVELIQDAVFDFETFVERTAARRIGRIFNRIATDGMTGTNFDGIAALAGAGVTAAMQTEFTHDDIIDMIHSVDPAYREGDMESGEWGARAMVPGSGMVGWMVSDDFIRKMMQLTDSDARPLWTVNAVTGAPNMIQGYPYVRNQHLDKVVASGIPALFGNLGHFWCRNIGGIYIGNFWDSGTAPSFQHHFIAFLRRNTKLVGPKAGNFADAIKKLTMAA